MTLVILRDDNYQVVMRKGFISKLFLEIDNSPLIIFRIFFGFLLSAETFGAILTGWVKVNLITPKLYFPFIGFEWLHPLPGFGMYIYFVLMGILGICVMVGYRYRVSLGVFTLLWTAQYLMQKTTYNNHYYFLILVCFIMLFLPANAYFSADARRNKNIQSLVMPAWCSVVMMAQIAILYFYATVAKIYPDWLDGTFTKLLYSGRTNFPLIGRFFTEKWFYLTIAYLGILFDGLVVPLLLWKKTRNYALITSLIFHLFNSITLQIGIFPYFALSFSVFFYAPETIRRIFFKKRPEVISINYNYKTSKIFYAVFIPYFLIQVFLPIRQFFIKGNTYWTDEAHRMSWRMMLRTRSGSVYFKIVDKNTNKVLNYNINDVLTPKQVSRLGSSADMIWQMAQIIKKEFKSKGKEVAVYAESFVSVNGHSYKRFIDEKTDLASVKWDYFFHNNWILLYDDYRK